MIFFKIRRATGPGRVRTSAPVSSPCSLFPSGTGLQSWSPVRTPLGVLRWGSWGTRSLRSNSISLFLSPPKIDPEIDSDFDRFLESKSLQNRSKIHQNSIQKSMLFSIPFSDRFLIDFWSLQTMKMLIFHCRGAHFHEIALSRKLSQHDQFLIKQASKI